MISAIVGAKVFDGSRFHEDCAVIVDGETIQSVVKLDSLPVEINRVVLDGGILAPGFIDLQVNGGGGAFFTNDTTVEALITMVDGHRKTGTTSMLPTLISNTFEVQNAGVNAVLDAHVQGLASILGVHVEGPFFSMSKRGAHKEEFIREMNDDDLSWLREIPDVKVMVTLSPEVVEPHQIKSLSEAGVFVCAGHSNADYETTSIAIENGVKGFTHLYNGMSSQTGRAPGVVGAALDSQDTWCGIIADNHHVHPASIRIALKAKPQGKVYLVSDSMSTVGAETKSFELYGETIAEQNGALVNAAGSLAGSAIGMIDAVRITHKVVGVELEESLRMASLYPAEFIQLDSMLGKIKNGYRADLVHFSDDFVVHNTWVAGAHQHHMS